MPEDKMNIRVFTAYLWHKALGNNVSLARFPRINLWLFLFVVIANTPQ